MKRLHFTLFLSLVSIILCLSLFLSHNRDSKKTTFYDSDLNKLLLNVTIDININFTADEKAILNLLKKNTIGNLVIITSSNNGFREMTLNWIKSLERLNITKFLVFSFDQDLTDYLKIRGYGDNVVPVPKTWFYRTIGKESGSFNTKNYYAITQAKTNIFYKLLTWNKSFIFSDVDSVWLSSAIFDYIDLIHKYSAADIIYSQDFESRNRQLNTGFFYATPTEFTKKLYCKLTEIQLLKEKSIDQFVLRELLLNISRDKRIEIFDFLLIANGQFYFQKKMHDKFKVQPFVVHANYFPSYETKKKALMSKNFWFIN